jgi:hypothetical protein
LLNAVAPTVWVNPSGKQCHLLGTFFTKVATGNGTAIELHPDKTRRIEFGRIAEDRREKEGKPEPFDSLGLPTSAGRTGTGCLR